MDKWVSTWVANNDVTPIFDDVTTDENECLQPNVCGDAVCQNKIGVNFF